MRRIGVLGGTFDPIHLGHLAVAQGALHLAGLERVLFIPAGQPPHKEGRRITAAEHRAEMVRLAIAENPLFELSTIEMDRQGPSYTILTVQALKAQNPDWEIHFIAGMDSLEEIQTWHEYRTLLSLVRFLVAIRPGFGGRRSDRVLRELGPDLAGRVRILEIPGLEISGTDLRQRAAEGYPLRYLIPRPVIAYIETHGLYRGDLR